MPMLNANGAVIFRNICFFFLSVMLCVRGIRFMGMRKYYQLPRNKS